MHCCATSPAGWPGAAYEYHLPEVPRRLGCVIRLMSTTLSGPSRILQWAPKFTRKLVERSLGGGGEMFTISEMVEHMTPSREFYVPFEYMSPGVIAFEGRESLSTDLPNEESIA